MGDISIKPAAGSAAAIVSQPATPPSTNSVATELPAIQTVTATAPGLLSSSDLLSRQAFVDAAAASIVYQVIDPQTSAVVSQYPDAATLRRRTYFRSVELAKSDAASIPGATDRKA
jgi:hypothetical protein